MFGREWCNNCEKEVSPNDYIRKQKNQPADHFKGCNVCGLPLTKERRQFHGMSSQQITNFIGDTR